MKKNTHEHTSTRAHTSTHTSTLSLHLTRRIEMAGRSAEGEAGRLLHQKRVYGEGRRGTQKTEETPCWKNAKTGPPRLKTYVCFANTLQYFLGVLCCVCFSASPSLSFRALETVCFVRPSSRGQKFHVLWRFSCFSSLLFSPLRALLPVFFSLRKRAHQSHEECAHHSNHDREGVGKKNKNSGKQKKERRRVLTRPSFQEST